MRDMSRRELEQWHLFLAADQIPTCRMIWRDATGPSGGVFESGAVMEVAGMQRAPVGSQRGTYFKTSKTRYDPAICPEPMTVWRYGGRDPDDVLSGAGKEKP